MTSDYIESLQTRLNNAEESLRLVQERQSEYVQAVNIPLELIRDERRLQKEVAELRAALEQVLADKTCPYRSLQPFGQEHASFFFGRDEVVSRLVEKVQTSGLVVVVGPSGSGKSSLLQAGLIHTLKASGQAWEDITFRPRKAPLDELASALVDLHDPRTLGERLGEIETIAKLLRENAKTASRALGDVLGSRGDTPLLLVIDQFEELYTQTKDELTQRQFIDALLAAADGDERVHVVLAVRADFYGYLLGDPELGPKLDTALFNVRPLTRDELRAAIEGPALLMGRVFEPGLADALLVEVTGQPGNLPLLEFALAALWDRQTADRILTFAAYDAIGRVTGALSQTAENVYAKYERQHQEERVRGIFIRLVQPGVNTQDTRRRASRSELQASLTDSHNPVWLIVQDLADSRLVVTDRDPNTEEKTVEVAHEALIGAWKRLAGWIEADREFLTWRQSRLDPQLRTWAASEKDPGSQLHGETLMAAGRWLRDRTEDISDEERAFVFESIMQSGGDLRSWASSLQPVNKALHFLDGYLAADDVVRRARAVQALRYLHIPGREKRVYVRLECLVLRDPSDEIRSQAALAICDRNEIAQVVALRDKDLTRLERQHVRDALVRTRNEPSLGKLVGKALEKRKPGFQVRVTWDLLIRYRNEIAVTLVMAYLVGQLVDLGLSPLEALMERFAPFLADNVIYWSLFDTLLVLALMLYLYVQRTLVDQEQIARRDRLLAGGAAAMFTIPVATLWSLVTMAFGYPALGWSIFARLITVVGIVYLALFFRPIPVGRSVVRKCLQLSFLSVSIGVLACMSVVLLVQAPFIYYPYTSWLLDVLRHAGSFLAAVSVAWLQVGCTVFACLLGFQYGLRAAFRNQFAGPGLPLQSSLKLRPLPLAVLALILIIGWQFVQGNPYLLRAMCYVTAPGHTSGLTNVSVILSSWPIEDSVGGSKQFRTGDFLRAGTCVVVTERDQSGEWVHIRQDDVDGWIPVQDIKWFTRPEQLPVH